jgi:hypothetical protein
MIVLGRSGVVLCAWERRHVYMYVINNTLRRVLRGAGSTGELANSPAVTVSTAARAVSATTATRMLGLACEVFCLSCCLQVDDEHSNTSSNRKKKKKKKNTSHITES